MPGTAYDYLMSVFIVGIIFVAAVAVIPNVAYLNMLYVDQQQLRNIALEAFKAMLLDAGYPLNWGSSINFNQSRDEIERFGLALADSFSFYVLDPDKVQRLVENNPMGFIEYERVRQLLGLEGYGFSLSIIAPFNVTANDLSQGNNLLFEASVKYNDQGPIPNAIVKALITYAQYEGQDETGENLYSIHFVEAENATDELGKCRIEETVPADVADYMVVLQAAVADVAAITTVFSRGFEPENEADINMVGDNITLTIPEEMPDNPNAARWVDTIIAVYPDELVLVYNGSSPRSNEDKFNYGSLDWNRVFDGLKLSNPIMLIFSLYTVEKNVGRTEVLIAGPYPNYMGSRVFQYGGSISRAGAAAVKLHRTVIISGMVYIAELILWKES